MPAFSSSLDVLARPWRALIPISLGALLFAAELSAQHPSYPVRSIQPKQTDYEPPPSTPEARQLWRDFYFSIDLEGRRDNRVIPDVHMEILKRWAEKPDFQTLDLLAEFEARLDRRDPCFISVEDRNLEGLLEIHPGALAPVLALHTFAWQHHLDNKRFNFLASTTKRVERWARWHVEANEEGQSARARAEAADTLARLGAMIWEAGYINLLDQATSALNEALDHQPSHLFARYLRGMVAERTGSFKAAHEDYETLSLIESDRLDIRLRLAVQEARLGKTAMAVKNFRSIIAAPGTGVEAWPIIVASQELARLESQRGRLGEAKKVLLAAEKRFPENERFQIQLAELERRQKENTSQRSGRLVSEFIEKGPGTEMSPRVFYLRIPEADLTQNALQVEQGMQAGLEPLRAAIDGFGDTLAAPRCGGMNRDLLPRPIEGAAESTPPSAPGSPDTPPKVLGQSQAPPSAATPPHPSKPHSATPSSEPRPASPSAISAPAKDPGQAPSPDASPSRAEIEASLRRGVYIDPDTGQEIRIDLALDLELRQIYVTPSRRGKRGTPLAQGEMTLLDEGVAQEIVTFRQGDIPFTATVLIDASGSMQGSRLAHALAGSQTFIAGMAKHDRARLLVGTDRLQNATPLLGAATDLREHLHAHAEGGTALFDHLFVAVDALEPEQGRKVVIVLSDGYDLMSTVPMASISEALRRSQIQLYWVRLRDGRQERLELIPPTLWRSTRQTKAEIELLEEAVEKSGGRVVSISRFDDVQGAFGEILEELRSQVAIGYYAEPARGDGAWRRVEVETSRGGVRLRHVEGYFDE